LLAAAAELQLVVVEEMEALELLELVMVELQLLAQEIWVELAAVAAVDI